MIVQSMSVPIEPVERRMYDVNDNRFVDVKIERLLVQVRTDLPSPHLHYVRVGNYFVIVAEEIAEGPKTPVGTMDTMHECRS